MFLFRVSVPTSRKPRICPEHQGPFLQACQTLQEARQTSDRTQRRAGREAFLRVRQQIRDHCQLHFLPGEPSLEEVLTAAPQHALVYLAAMNAGGLALVLPPARANEAPAVRHPSALALPRLTRHVVDAWLVRRDAAGAVIGGLRVALEQFAYSLVAHWIVQAETEAELARRRAMPVQAVAAALPETLLTLRQALQRLVASWQAEADLLSGGSPAQRQEAKTLRALLALPLEQAFTSRVLRGELDWFLHEAELDQLLPALSDVILMPLRQELTALGLNAPDQPIALIACGQLGMLPLHAALVADPQRGEAVPFQETCTLTYQASARTLAASQAAVANLPTAGALLAVGDPQPTRASQLPWAEAEAEVIAHLARQAGRAGSQAILGEEASLPRLKRELATIRTTQRGAWVQIASHGHADPTDPTNCFLLLAADEHLTLAELQQAHLLDGVRGFAASGCVTALGDLETAPDELSSFAAGLLHAGAACALATQWAVSDRATFLLMLRFHQLLLGDPLLPPARALREAARWLRTATRQQLDHLAQAGLAEVRPLPPLGEADHARDAVRGALPHTVPEALDAASLPEELRFLAAEALKRFRWVGNLERAEERPYAHPIYWASTVVYGA